MYQSSISLSAQLDDGDDGLQVVAHGSVIVKNPGASVNVKRIKTASFKSRTLSLELDIVDEGLQQAAIAKPFVFIEKVTDSDELDQVELSSNQDHHMVIDIYEPEKVYNDFSVERDLRQSLSSAEKKLSQMGSVVLMSKGGSKQKDNK